MIGVYKITNPIGQVYVGSSKNIEKRWKGHKTLLQKNHRKLIESFGKYGVENHKFEVVIECKKDQLKELETFYGLKLNALDREKGLNLMLPKLKDGSGGCSEDRIIWNKGKKGLQVAWNKGLKGVCVAWNKGIPMREDSKEKMRVKKTGVSSPRKGIKTGKPSNNSRVILDTYTGVFYDSCTEAAKLFGYKRQTLQAMLSGINPNKTNLKYV